MREVVVEGCGMTRFGRQPERPLGELAAEAVGEALADADLYAADIEFVAFSNVMAGTTTGQNSMRGQALLTGTGLQGLPMVNVENACASGGTAVHLAWLAVASGRVETAIAVGAEQMWVSDREALAKTMLSGVNLDRLAEIRATVDPERRNPGDNGFFMDVYAHGAREYMAETGCTERDLAEVSVKNRAHGALNPKAQFNQTVSIEEVLDSRMISPPLRLLMCSPLSDGAAAVVFSSREGSRVARPVRLLASELGTGIQGESGSAIERTASAAYAAAGLGPGDLDLIELHDAAASAELIAYEQLGLCGKGEGSRLVVDGVTRLGGSTPVNTSGGLITKGHPVGATGCAQIVELTDQLRGRAGKRQVADARVALAMNAGGFVEPRDVAACAITILTTGS